MSTYTNNYRRNLELYWQQFYPNWKIPTGFHVHHIKPICTFKDGNDPLMHHPKNLIALHPDDHITIHKCRGDKISNGILIIANRIRQPHTEETKQKMRQSHKKRLKGTVSPILGRKHTKTSIDKMVKSSTGVLHSDSTKQKMSIDRKGKDNNMFGKHHSLESKKKMSESRKQYWADRKNSKI